jgi:RNA polymerase sigma-70 factor (ECF subfamily)
VWRGDRSFAVTDDDSTLLLRVAGGDRGAFAALVERHWASMHRYATVAGRDGAAAEDALQEAFTAVWRFAGSYRGGCARAWLYTIAKNALHHELKARLCPADDDAIEGLGRAAGWGDAHTGDRVLRTIEDRDCLNKALSRLSLEDREAVLLVDVEELTAEEAAQALGLGTAALKSRLHRARLRLCAELAKEASDEG